MDPLQWHEKMNEREEIAYHRRKQRRRMIVIGVSTFLLLLIVIGSIAGAIVNNKRDESSGASSWTSMASSIKIVCNVTLYPDSCVSSISEAANGTTVSDPKTLFKISLKVAAEAISKLSSVPDALSKLTSDKAVQDVLANCKEMFEEANDRVNDSIELLATKKELITSSKINTLRSWLSAAITDQGTCLDELENTTSSIQSKMKHATVNSTQFTSNSLAIATKILSHLQDFGITFNRKLLSTDTSAGGLPDWISSTQRRALLQDRRVLTPNVTVAMDGTGQFRTINGALSMVPKMNEFLFVIRIKAGVYNEIVKVDKNMWNVVMVGDGMDKTIVTGSLNRIDGIKSTSLTATFTAVGKNFMAMDMRFENSAGPEKHQAVAMRSASEFSLFYRCTFMGFQDTLYAHSLRQFYRDCDVVGTVDFIFGDATVVFQNCTIRPRQPMPNQMNTITAQGRKDPNESTGISIHNCTVKPYDNVTVQTYLGRPWKEYSTTVIMQSEIGMLVVPEGYLEWTQGVVPPSTIFYAEYQNRGDGATVDRRVRWPGYHPAISESEAENFGVDSFIQGSEWLPPTGVAFVGSV